jgi:hypothetical protein
MPFCFQVTDKVKHVKKEVKGRADRSNPRVPKWASFVSERTDENIAGHLKGPWGRPQVRGYRLRGSHLSNFVRTFFVDRRRSNRRQFANRLLHALYFVAPTDTRGGPVDPSSHSSSDSDDNYTRWASRRRTTSPRTTNTRIRTRETKDLPRP